MKRSTPSSSPLATLPLLLLLLAAIVYGCANRVPPGGGPYDDMPPRLIKATPEQGALHVKQKKIVLYFDEYVQIKDPSKKIIISPPQMQMPTIQALGKRVEVILKDSLIPQTTYTIDFTNSIVDNNENNELENFSYAFSTGAEIDSMQIAGMVLDARTLEPIPEVMVGVHPENAPGNAFRDTTLLRMSRTSDRAHFVIRNIKDGRYRLYALQESDGNYRYNAPTEGIAFMDTLVQTRAMAAVRTDTLRRDSLTIDTIKEVKYTRFLPDDVVLRFFTAATQRQFITKRERPDSATLQITFHTPADSTVRLSCVGKGASDKHAYALDYRAKGELCIFLLDKSWQNAETFTISYLSLDSIGKPVTVTDTLKLKRPKGPSTDQGKEESDVNRSDAKKTSPLEAKLERRGAGGVSDSLILTTTTPIDTAAFSGISLYRMQDSTLHEVRIDTIMMLPRRSCQALIQAKLEYKTDYELHIDTVAFRDLWGNTLGETKVEKWTTKAASDLSRFEVVISGAVQPFILELLDEQDKVVRSVFSSTPTILMKDLAPGKYYLRLIEDRNGNGQWDTGDYDKRLQPEIVYYAPKGFELMKNWRVRENWDPTRIPLSQQKPQALIKNKPQERKKIDRNRERERERQAAGRSSYSNPLQNIRGGLGGGGL